jgi:hypothetical protein
LSSDKLQVPIEEEPPFEEEIPPAPEGCKTVLATKGAIYNALGRDGLTFVMDPEGESLDSERFKENKPVVWNILYGEPLTENDQQVIESLREVANRPDAIVAEKEDVVEQPQE